MNGRMILTLEPEARHHMTQRRRPSHQPSRDDAKAARDYAEAMYQALRRWEVQTADDVAYSSGPSGSSRFQVVGVGNWRSGQGGGTMMTTQSLLVLPGGSVPENQFGLIMLDLLNSGHRQHRVCADLLARIRSGHSPVSLLDERGGWRSERQRSIWYAVAVTELMVRLGNDRATDHLNTLLLLPKSED